jgi:hypothetical protein
VIDGGSDWVNQWKMKNPLHQINSAGDRVGIASILKRGSGHNFHVPRMQAKTAQA